MELAKIHGKVIRNLNSECEQGVVSTGWKSMYHLSLPPHRFVILLNARQKS